HRVGHGGALRVRHLAHRWRPIPALPRVASRQTGRPLAVPGQKPATGQPQTIVPHGLDDQPVQSESRGALPVTAAAVHHGRQRHQR
nr:hypothetical protein [Tanacetum cinerariifolium]